MADNEEEKAEESAEKENESVKQEEPPKTVKKEKKRYIFNCTKCGTCCKNRTSVPLTIRDIENWTTKGIIQSVLPHLFVEFIPVEGSQGQFVQLVMKKPSTGKDEEPPGCPMFDESNSICNIYHNMPIDCASYPLGYNGKSFFIRDKTCEGIGHGSMTKEQLMRDRELAEEDFRAKVSTTRVFPILTTLLNKFFMEELLEQQKKMRESLSEEEKAKLDDIDSIFKNKTSSADTSGTDGPESS